MKRESFREEIAGEEKVRLKTEKLAEGMTFYFFARDSVLSVSPRHHS